MTYYPVDWEKRVRVECKRRKYSDRTAKTYIYCINRFLDWSRKELGKIGKKDVRLFLEHLSEKGLSGNSMNTYHMAIRFLFENVFEKRMWIDIKYSKIPEKIPVVLSKEEVRKMLNCIDNWKHRLMIETMYSAGLRVSELINLKVNDLVLDRDYGFVRNGKGGKDRFFVIAHIVNEKLRNLIEMEKLNSEDYLFVSLRKKKYDSRSLQQIVKKASRTAGLSGVHCHTLRHSFATHLIDNGYSVSDVQAMLGHKSPETSMIYVHTSTGNMINVRSPLDRL